MDLTIIADLLSSIDPIVLGSVAGGFLVAGGAGLYVKRNKNKFIENTDPFAQPNDFKTLKTEDLEREFGSLTVQTKMLDEDESLFFDKTPKDKLNENELTQPSTKLVDEASVFDSFGKQEQALESLKKAVDIEKHDKERLRLKIILSQYNIKKGKVSLDEIIKEYPSFHAKVAFGPDNTLSALMGSAIPKTDADLHKTINKEIDKEFDIFADLPILNESTKVTEQNVSPVGYQKNLFDDLPNIEEVNHSRSNDTEPNAILTATESPLFNSQSEPAAQNSTQLSLFDDLPPINNIQSDSKEEKSQLGNIPDNSFSTQEDQFSWNSNSSNENDTEKMLKELQKDSEKVDKINETEAMDDMQKFWQEFGSMVVDIKKEVAENHTPTNKTSSTEDVIPFSMLPDNLANKEEVIAPQVAPIVSSDIPSLSEPINTLAEQNSNVETNKASEDKETQSSTDLEPPVLHVVIESPKVPISTPAVNYSVDSVMPTPSIPEPTPILVTKENPVVNNDNHDHSVIPVPPTPVILQAPVEEPVKPQTFKVWANWIVTIEGQQVFRNHFINLKNPWGSIKAGEELYGGISRLSGKDISGKNYPWVLVSVFPLSKD